MSDAVWKVSITRGGDNQLLATFDIRIQEGLSAGLVKRIVHELGGKKFKGALDLALSSLSPKAQAK